MTQRFPPISAQTGSRTVESLAALSAQVGAIDGRVSVLESASSYVLKAGDTMTGNLTVPQLYADLVDMDSYQSTNPGGGAVAAAWEDDWWRYRFGGTSDPRGIRIDNYDTNGILLDRLGTITVEAAATIDLKAGNNKIRGLETDDTVNWSIGNSTGTDNLLIDSLRTGAGIYLRAADSGGTLRNRVFIDGDAATSFWDEAGTLHFKLGGVGAGDRALIYNEAGSAVFGVSTTGSGAQWGRHPDSGSWQESWPFGSVRSSGSALGSATSVGTGDTTLDSFNLACTANEPIAVLAWYSVRTENASLNSQYWFARASIGGTYTETSPTAIFETDLTTGLQSANHTHTGPSHQHLHSTTHRHQGASDVDVAGITSSTNIQHTSGTYKADTSPYHGVDVDVYGNTDSVAHTHASGTYSADTSTLLTTWVAPGTSDSGGTGNTGSNSASHSHSLTGGYNSVSGITYRAYTPTGSTVQILLSARTASGSISMRGYVMAIAWRT